MPETRVPLERIRSLTEHEIRSDGDFVLYWMTAFRRVRWNFALDRAVDLAKEMGKPLVVLEPLRAAYPHASERVHRFVIEGMQENWSRLENSPALYYPYIEPQAGKGKGLVRSLSKRACAIVTDDFPAFFIPRMLESASRQVKCRLEAVDGNGILPVRAPDRIFPSAYAFRRYLQKHLRYHLNRFPRKSPLARSRLKPAPSLPATISKRWPPADLEEALTDTGMTRFDFKRSVPPISNRGGSKHADRQLSLFLQERLHRYVDDRNKPGEQATSGLSPYLHFGHLSSHQVFESISRREQWVMERLSRDARGKREGWWGMAAEAEAFLDQLVTWRELGFNACTYMEDPSRYESLPPWSKTTLAVHAGDRRNHVYDLDTFEAADTHDPLWNAAQTQLRREGVIHNYLRMLWGKKILEWSSSPESSLEIMLTLNDRWALDGRDPNSLSGIFWCLGRYDRPWGPERPVYGKIRYMSIENTYRKFNLSKYLHTYT